MASCLNNTAKMAEAIDILTICPITRMVAEIPLAIPAFDGCTELIIVFILGEENNPKPNPINARLPIMKYKWLLAFRKKNKPNPIPQISIPNEANQRGSIRSDNLPATGETTAIIRG